MRKILVAAVAATSILVAAQAQAAEGRHRLAAVAGGAGLLVGAIAGSMLSGSSEPQRPQYPQQHQYVYQPAPQVVYVPQPAPQVVYVPVYRSPQVHQCCGW